MNVLQTIRVTFTCSCCGSTNELTATHVHEGTLIHCSRCSSSVARLADLLQHEAAPARRELVSA